MNLPTYIYHAYPSICDYQISQRFMNAKNDGKYYMRCPGEIQVYIYADESTGLFTNGTNILTLCFHQPSTCHVRLGAPIFRHPG